MHCAHYSMCSTSASLKCFGSGAMHKHTSKRIARYVACQCQSIQHATTRNHFACKRGCAHITQTNTLAQISISASHKHMRTHKYFRTRLIAFNLSTSLSLTSLARACRFLDGAARRVRQHAKDHHLCVCVGYTRTPRTFRDSLVGYNTPPSANERTNGYACMLPPVV